MIGTGSPQQELNKDIKHGTVTNRNREVENVIRRTVKEMVLRRNE